MLSVTTDNAMALARQGDRIALHTVYVCNPSARCLSPSKLYA